MSKKKRSSNQKILPNSSELNPCPLCQIPLHFLKISGETHLIRCETNSWDGAGECPDGIECFSSSFYHYWDFTHHVLAKHRGLNLNTSKNKDESNSPGKKSQSPRKNLSPRKSPGKKTQKKPTAKTKRKHKVLSDDSSDDDFIALPKNSQSSPIKERTPKKARKSKCRRDTASGDESSDSGVLFFSPDSSSTQCNGKSSYSQNIEGNEEKQEEGFGHFLYSSSQDMFSNYPQDNVETDDLNVSTTDTCNQWHIQSVDDEKIKQELTPTKADSDMFGDDLLHTDYPTPTKYLTQALKEIPDASPEDYFKSQMRVDDENPAEEKPHHSTLNGQAEEMADTPVQFSDSDDDCEIDSETGEILFTAKYEDDNSQSSSMKQVDDDPLVMEDIKKVSKHLETIQAWKKIFGNKQNERPEPKMVPIIETQEPKYHTSTDRAPFYKLIPDTDFVVDGFKSGPVVNKNNYFLSHFHYDHYIGLNKHFSRTIHCSTITGELLKTIIRIDAKYIRTIDVGEVKVINQVEVTALDANHCPGALMFVFKTLHGHSYLHTGDFRADLSMQNLDILRHTFFEKVYLDTTYCNPNYNFPSQQAVIDRLVEMIEENHKKYPKTLYICGSYTIGKEKVYISILEKMKWNIYVESYKRRILDILNIETINSRLVDKNNAFQAKLHVIAMSKLNNIHHLLTYYETYKSKYDRVVAIKPTGWTYSERNDNNINVKRIDENISIYEISYSEHSSFVELCTFVKFLKYKQIVCTVNVKNSEKQVQMIDNFIKKKLGSQVTNTLNSYFMSE